jgi:cell division septum initiation protein DivIVA
LGFAIPFLFVFGVLTYITYEAKKEINRPLLLIYFIIDLLITIFFPAILISLAIILVIVLLLFGFYKLFHTLTGSRIGGFTGAIITTLILYVLLTNGTNIIGFLFSSAIYILLFIFFIFIFIYGYKLSQSSNIKKLKKLIYHIHKPEDVRNFENQVNMYIINFSNKARSLEQVLTDIQTKLNEFNNLLNQRQSLQQLTRQIQHILNRLPQQLQGQIQNLIPSSLQQVSQRQIGQIISQLRQIKQQLPKQHQQYIRQLINLLNQLRQQKQLLKQLKDLKREIKRLLNDYNKRYKDFNDDYNRILNFINTAITNFHQNYNDPKSPGIIRFLTNKGNELQSIKGNIDHKHMMILHNPDAQKLINNYILK